MPVNHHQYFIFDPRARIISFTCIKAKQSYSIFGKSLNKCRTAWFSSTIMLLLKYYTVKFLSQIEIVKFCLVWYIYDGTHFVYLLCTVMIFKTWLLDSSAHFSSLIGRISRIMHKNDSVFAGKTRKKGYEDFRKFVHKQILVYYRILRYVYYCIKR